jgi:hypothetical protein
LFAIGVNHALGCPIQKSHAQRHAGKTAWKFHRGGCCVNSTGTLPASQSFGADKTVRWPCRVGEFVLWVSIDSFLFLNSSRPSIWTIRDFWQMREGDFVTISNRWPDLPPWFELHPSEVEHAAALEMAKRLNAGYQPRQPLARPNIWRVPTGDRLIWVTTNDPNQPVREILNLGACALVIRENTTPEVMNNLVTLTEDHLAPAQAIAMRTGFDAAVSLGAPREFAAEWKFGA